MRNETNATLPSPRLFQAQGGVLDLQSLNPPNPNIGNDPGDPVVVSVLVPYGATGEVVVWFGDNNSLNFPVTDSKRVVQDVCFRKDQLPAPGQSYNVRYQFGGKSSNPVSVTLIDSGNAPPPTTARHARSLFGTYAAGAVDAWVIPAPRKLLKADPVIRSIAGGHPKEGTSLEVRWLPESGDPSQIGKISYQQNEWSIKLDQDGLLLSRLDILALQTSADETFLNFSLNV